MFQLQVASRKKVKIKIGISSPTGFGKTYSALLLAYGMTGDWSKIAVIDSENESAGLYSDLGNYFTIPMPPPYTVDRFCQAVDSCVKGGIEVIVVDSTYHYWHGKGGLLEYNQSLGGRYQDWAKTNPLYAKWLDAILQTPVHFICTSRKKQAYEMTKDSSGRTIVEKKGMEDQIRDGFDFEMTLAFTINNANHMAEAAKDRTRLFMNQPEFVITSETGKIIKEWCDEGAEVVKPTRSEFLAKWQSEVNTMSNKSNLMELYNAHRATIDADEDLKAMFSKRNSQLTAKATV